MVFIIHLSSIVWKSWIYFTLTIDDAVHAWVNEFSRFPTDMIAKLMSVDEGDEWREVTRCRVGDRISGYTIDDGEIIGISDDGICTIRTDGGEIVTGDFNSDFDKYKILIPQEFGGGYIVDTYFDYGRVFSEYTGGYYVDSDGNKYAGEQFGEADLFGILAYMNDCSDLNYIGSNMPKNMYDILKFGKTQDQQNRFKGIDVDSYDDGGARLKFPMKLVSASYSGTYEECMGRSYTDPNQGFCECYWSDTDYKCFLSELESAEAERRVDAAAASSH